MWERHGRPNVIFSSLDSCLSLHHLFAAGGGSAEFPSKPQLQGLLQDRPCICLLEKEPGGCCSPSAPLHTQMKLAIRYTWLTVETMPRNGRNYYPLPLQTLTLSCAGSLLGPERDPAASRSGGDRDKSLLQHGGALQTPCAPDSTERVGSVVKRGTYSFMEFLENFVNPTPAPHPGSFPSTGSSAVAASVLIFDPYYFLLSFSCNLSCWLLPRFLHGIDRVA